MFGFHRRSPRKRRAAAAVRRRTWGLERLEARLALTLPYGAGPDDTAEFMLGDVLVTLVLMESSTQTSNVNNNSETWTTADINAVKAKVVEGMNWWVETLGNVTDKHSLSFEFDFTYADNPVSTRYEPITRPSTDFQFWIYDFLNVVGQNNGGSYSNDIRGFNHAQRLAHDTNWAFTIFVVNDKNDADGMFAPGGLDRAFAFPGGQFLVSPARRPASTFAHETGHIFWAMDEYQGGGAYTASRGYYNTPNSNAWNNPIFVGNQTPRAPSVMDRGACEEGGGLLCTAWQQHTSSTSSLEMIGWRDSDGDGVFDVLDVEHSLAGDGRYEPATGQYRFIGSSAVQTLPNRNPTQGDDATSTQNDMTLNRIRAAQYRIDGGDWQTATTFDDYQVSLDLTFAAPMTATLVEIRTVDTATGVASAVFAGTLAQPASVAAPGISGFVFQDGNGDGDFDSGESPLSGQTVRLVDGSGAPLTLQRGIEPDDHASGTVLNTVDPNVTLTAVGSNTATTSVYSRGVSPAATGSRVFSSCTFASGANCTIFNSEWTTQTRTLKIAFSSPVTSLSLDAVADTAGDQGRLEIYDASDRLLARYTTRALGLGEVETMTLQRSTADIAYAIAKGHDGAAIRLDNLHYGPTVSANTNSQGAYSLPFLPAGDYVVQVVPPAGQEATTATTQAVTLTAGAATAGVNFGFGERDNSWQNPTNRFDVNNDGAVVPQDALILINDLNAQGSRALPAGGGGPPYLDVNGDFFIAPNDVLAVVNAINSQGGGAGESVGRAVGAAVWSERADPRDRLFATEDFGPGVPAGEAPLRSAAATDSALPRALPATLATPVRLTQRAKAAPFSGSFGPAADELFDELGSLPTNAVVR